MPILQFNHHMPELWTDPSSFDPLRFAPDRAEDRVHRYAWVPFGGGVHHCIDMHFATAVVNAVMTQLLQRYEWSVEPGYEVPWNPVRRMDCRSGCAVGISPMESLPRIDFVELHDLDRTPAVLRTLHTESIAFIYWLTDAAREYSVPLSLALRSGADHRIVDLCAGSGGPVPLIQRRLHREGVHTQVTLTDLVPNVPAFQRVQAAHRRVLPDCCSVDYVSSSVDATDCRVEGTRTIYGAFHHFPPPLARRMLQNAVDTRSPMVVVDTKRSLLYVLVFPFLTTLAVLLSAPFQRNPLPRYLLRLVLTYLVPVLPFMMFFDSVVSFLRMYGRGELRWMVDGLDNTESFTWQIGVVPGFTGAQYLIGVPRR